MRDNKLTNGDITNKAIRSGQGSINNPALKALQMKKYLLGGWLDPKLYPDFVKKKAREVFKSHHTYRLLWNPIIDGTTN